MFGLAIPGFGKGGKSKADEEKWRNSATWGSREQGLEFRIVGDAPEQFKSRYV